MPNRRTLTRRQTQRLRDVIQPIIDDEVQRLGLDAEDTGLYAERRTTTGYAEKILNGQSTTRTRRRKELPEAARVFARLGFVAAMSDGDRGQALDLARNLDIEAEYKSALSAGSAEGGGLLLVDQQADEVIQLLRPTSVMRRVGAIEIPIPRGTMRTPRIDVGTVSGYVAEGQAIPATELKTGAVVLVARKLATLIVLTNELSKFGEQIDQILVDDMLLSIGEAEDKAFLFGKGSEAEPLGITGQVAASNKVDATQAGASATLTEVQGDLRKAEQVMLDADVPMRRPTWIMSPRSRLFLRDLRDTEDRGAFGKEMASTRTINGIPFQQTNNIPNNLGAGSDESLVILVDGGEVMLGDVPQIEVDRSTSAVVKIDGVDVNLFETDRRALRVRGWNDLRLRHDVGAAVIEKVLWGA